MQECKENFFWLKFMRTKMNMFVLKIFQVNSEKNSQFHFTFFI